MTTEAALDDSASKLLTKGKSLDVEMSSTRGSSISNLNSPTSPTSPKDRKTQVKKERKDSVAKQTEAVNTPGTIWYHIKNQELEKTVALIKEKPELLRQRGPVGETPLHMCFLFHQPGHLAIAKKIVEVNPETVLDSYEHKLYQGETCLHLSIVNKDFPMVKWLVEINKKLIDIPATGDFFQGDSPCYYGEYPLAFAASTNNIPMVKYLLSKGANLWQTDSIGNSILHLLVIHGRERMYEFILEKEKEFNEAEAKNDIVIKRTPLSQVKNKAGYTPLTLAALRGEKKIFEFVLELSKQNQWKYGPVSCDIYPLEEIDTLQPQTEDSNGQKEKSPTVLDIVIEEKHLEILTSARILGLLKSKWDSYARKAFMKRCWGTFFYVFIFTCAAICHSPYFYYDFSTSLDIGRLIAEILVVIGWLYKGKKEAQELYGSGFSYFTQQGSAFLENTLSFIFLISFPLAIICQAADNQETGIPNTPALYFMFICIMALWTYVLTLLLGFQLTGMFVIMLYKMAYTDVARFAILYTTVLIGHSIAFYSIEDPTQVSQYVYPPLQELGSDFTWFKEFWWRLEQVFYILLAQISWDNFESYTYDGYLWLTDLLLLFHCIFVPIMLLNILIAMIGDTFGDVKDNAFQEWTLTYAQIILSLESEITPSKLQRMTPYWTTIQNKRFLQNYKE